MSADKHKYLALVGLLVLSWTAPAQAVVYQWVDENGAQQFSQRPPPDRDYKAITPVPNPPGDVEEAKKRMQTILELQKASQEAREKRQHEQQEKTAKKKLRQQQCRQAQERLTNLQSRPRVRVTNADGTVRRISEEERQEKIRNTSSLIEEVCSD